MTGRGKSRAKARGNIGKEPNRPGNQGGAQGQRLNPNPQQKNNNQQNPNPQQQQQQQNPNSRQQQQQNPYPQQQQQQNPNPQQNNSNPQASTWNKGPKSQSAPTGNKDPIQQSAPQSAPPMVNPQQSVAPPSESKPIQSDNTKDSLGDSKLVTAMSRLTFENIKCKNDGFISQGSSGTPINLITNFFEMRQSQKFSIYQYHIDFQPCVDSMGIRKRLLKDHKEMIGPVKAFDGLILFCSRKFDKPITEVYSSLKDGTKIKIIIKFSTTVPRNSPTLIHVYNVIMKRILHIIGMTLIGRNYYNPSKGSQVKRHNLDIWPGFSTSINLFEKSILLQADISHKILRSDTVLSNIYELYRTNKQNFKQMTEKKFIGQIVLTRYNNKTYRIDDINWNENPTKKFTKRGEEISFIEYYKSQYKLDIRDLTQPLLVSNPKKKKVPTATLR